jgi:hypothetical protein
LPPGCEAFGSELEINRCAPDIGIAANTGAAVDARQRAGPPASITAWYADERHQLGQQ